MPTNLVEGISTAPRGPYIGAGYRQVAPAYDSLSGAGARIHGGRFNPPESFPVLYLCTTPGCAAAEFMRYANRQPIGPTGFLPRHLYRYEVELTAVLDLIDSATVGHLSVDPARIVDDDRTLPNEIGEIAHQFGYQAVLARSATGVDAVVAVFVENLRSGPLEFHLEAIWNGLDDLPALS